MEQATFNGRATTAALRGRDLWLLIGTIVATLSTMLTVVLQASL
jgi:hypothetical protein